MADNSAFISYRRGDGYPWARLIWDELQNRSINVFLDLESMRQAGRFDERILNQIAARPYFLLVLAEGSLDRCASESDWVRREIEHAIETNRTIVPLFIAPFETSHFPLDLPPHVVEALANSNGVTFYSQFLAAALDQLAAFLQPVALPTGELTDDDAAFEQRAISQVRAEPPPIVPITPLTETPLASEPLPDAPYAVPPIHTDSAREAGGSNGDWVPPPDDDASHTTTSGAVAAGATTGFIGGHTASVHTAREEARPEVVVPVEPTPMSRRKGIVIASVVAVALVLGGIVALTFLGLDDDGDASVATTNPETSASLDDGPQTSDAENVTTTVTTPPAELTPSRRETETWMNAGESIATEGGRFRLAMNFNGRLELLDGEVLLWEPTYQKDPRPGSSLRIQADGNLVIYPSHVEATAESAIGASGFQLHPDDPRARELRIVGERDSAYVEMVDVNGDRVWRRPEAPSTSESEFVAEEPDNPTTSDTTTPETPPSTTLPPALELDSVAVAADPATVVLRFDNHDDVAHAVEQLFIDVGAAGWSPVRRLAQDSDVEVHVLGRFSANQVCKLDQVPRDWLSIAPTGGSPTEERQLTFGYYVDDGSLDGSANVWEVELTFALGDGVQRSGFTSEAVTVEVRPVQATAQRVATRGLTCDTDASGPPEATAG